MDVTSRVTLITGLVTATIAFVGYLITQHSKRRDRRSQLYAEALEILANIKNCHISFAVEWTRLPPLDPI